MEIFWNGTWGTISDTDWGTSEAQVVCEQLGLPTGGKDNPQCAFTVGILFCVGRLLFLQATTWLLNDTNSFSVTSALKIPW